MTNIYIPDSIYQRLPKLYLLLALLLMITPIGPAKWLVIAILLAGTVIITRWRRESREAEQLRRATEITEKYRARLKQSTGSEATGSEATDSVVVL